MYIRVKGLGCLEYILEEKGMSGEVMYFIISDALLIKCRMSDMEESRDRGGAIQLYLFYYFRYCTQWSRMSGMDGASGGRDERPIQYS